MARLVHRWLRNVANLGAAGAHLLFPPRCAACDADLPESRDGLMLCADCRLELGPVDWLGCRRCGALCDGEPGSVEGCSACAGSRLKFDTVIPLGSYKDRLRGVMLRMKRATHDSLSEAMGRLLSQRRGDRISQLQADLIVPVPMFWTRRLIRGTNSPEIVAEALGRRLGVCVERRVLVRCRNTLPQKDLSPAERFRNVRGAFRVHRRHQPGGLRVLLVDDILTTGATCSEAARTLKRAGAVMVAACVLARAQGPNSM